MPLSVSPVYLCGHTQSNDSQQDRQTSKTITRGQGYVYENA